MADVFISCGFNPDERILGDSDFVESVLDAQNEKMERCYRLQAQGYDFDKVVHRAAELLEMEPKEIGSITGLLI